MADRLRPLVLALLLTPFACTSDGDKNDGPDSGGDGDGDGDPSFWLVGDEGTMIRVDGEGDASGYPLDIDADLLAIACHGSRTAWVAGEAGTVLHSNDAGQSWSSITADVLNTSGSWRALAVAEHSPEGAESLWLVGDGGAIAHTPDGGASWIAVPGADVSFTGVATGPDGNTAIAVADDGSIWQIDEHSATSIHAGSVALRGVDLAEHADAAVAVGDDGTMLRFAGDGWTPVELPTDRDLFAVRVAADDSRTVAVGEDGLVVRIVGGDVELLDTQDSTLRALHLGADGRGQSVGDAGTVLSSSDGGVSWIAWTLTDGATLRGVDDFHFSGHL